MPDLRQPRACPECGGRRVCPILYGLPAHGTLDQARRGEIVLGGCMIGPWQPDWACPGCGHRWFDPTDPAKQRYEEDMARHEAEILARSERRAAGVCSYCDGTGDCYCERLGSSAAGACARCNGSGQCHVCHGTGRLNDGSAIP